MIPILQSEDNPDVFKHSSISQHKNKFSVYTNGQWLPISYDVIDFIDCERIESHRAIVTDKDDIGYNFPTKKCCYYTDEYVYHDNNGTELRELPHWFGEGFYEASINEQDFINSDNGSLGVRNKYTLTTGLDYALATKTLDPAEE